ncbi:pyrroline-5-carboxylate reductase [Enterovirga aerilata]|uniref:Pyrroline-5-carboxylate reductase n=1 Tax=Enterovirga aerilata TaxID=2730920 RepID=A0A849IEJ4_9HYPH|nr:pyrroline-5-carboxylate reductase [Enterovirga sp. DB1703]NNM74397.1 pyrroline-5-carboxylate reductase [Enterovirga sp. DB1703]
MSSGTDRQADLPHSLLLVGAGKMGGAMLEGWLAKGLDPARVTVLDPNPSPALLDFAGTAGLRLNPDKAGLAPPEVLVLGIKPQALAEAAPDIAPFAGPETLVISILAGKTVGDLSRALPQAGAIVRAMPNLPASIGSGATGAYASPAATPRQRELTQALLSAVGTVEWIEREELIDAVTALSGSGPAYVFHLVECLSSAGREVGLDPEVAERLARQTVIGAAELLAGSGLDPAVLRRNVTSPGGTTAAALDILMAEDGLGALMRRAVEAAKRRAAELSG